MHEGWNLCFEIVSVGDLLLSVPTSRPNIFFTITSDVMYVIELGGPISRFSHNDLLRFNRRDTSSTRVPHVHTHRLARAGSVHIPPTPDQDS